MINYSNQTLKTIYLEPRFLVIGKFGNKTFKVICNISKLKNIVDKILYGIDKNKFWLPKTSSCFA